MFSSLPRLGLAGSLALAALGVGADEKAPPAAGPAPAQLSPPLPAAPSPGTPAFAPPEPAPPVNVDEAFRTKIEIADEEMLHLPKVVVKGPRPLRPDEVLAPSGQMDRYLGPKDGLDRGVLNRVTLRFGAGFLQLAFFDAMKNEDRAKEAYRDDRRLREREELMDFASRLKLVDQASAEMVKKESDSLFLRTTSLGRTSRPASPQTAVSDQR